MNSPTQIFANLACRSKETIDNMTEAQRITSFVRNSDASLASDVTTLGCAVVVVGGLIMAAPAVIAVAGGILLASRFSAAAADARNEQLEQTIPSEFHEQRITKILPKLWPQNEL